MLSLCVSWPPLLTILNLGEFSPKERNEVERWFFSFRKAFLFNSGSSKRMQITFNQSSPTPPPSQALLFPPFPLPTPHCEERPESPGRTPLLSLHLCSRVVWGLRQSLSFAFVPSCDCGSCGNITKLSQEIFFSPAWPSTDLRTHSGHRRLITLYLLCLLHSLS